MRQAMREMHAGMEEMRGQLQKMTRTIEELREQLKKQNAEPARPPTP
jgi:uncharacterized coiled-coil protein SlyX